MTIRNFLLPPEIIYGAGAVEKTGAATRKLKGNKVLVVTDEVMVNTGLAEKVIRGLENSGLGYSIYDQVSMEPTIEFVEEGLGVFKQNECDCIVAVGGGSPIDAAKAIAVMVNNPGSIKDYMGIEKIKNKGVPLMAVPTTAGTGSEATRVTIITDTSTDTKMLLLSSHLTPDVAVVDPLLTLSKPKGLTAATGIDALTHAIEAYVSIKAQPMTDIYALSAIKLISGNLRQAWANGNNLEARENTMLGSLQAGIAFSNSSVALVHGMSRPIGANFHVAHGDSNAALLGEVMDFSVIGNPARFARIALAMGENIEGLTNLEAAEKAVTAVKRLISDIKIPSLKELGVNREELERLAPKMAADAINSGSPGNNPRQATEEEIIDLYRLAYEQ